MPLTPPFSCLLDGIQVSTTCTVGNQRLQIKNSKIIKAVFTRKDDKTVKITLTKQFHEQLEQKLKQNQLVRNHTLGNLPSCLKSNYSTSPLNE